MLTALPFAISFIMLPCVALGAVYGGWYTALPLLWGWVIVSILDRAIGLDTSSVEAPSSALLWHRVVTWAWVPAQLLIIAGCTYAISIPGHLTVGEQVTLMASLGIVTGTVGITYAHELIHQRNRSERLLGEVLLISVGYGHFKTEHLLGHHSTVATPADPVSARPGQSLFRFIPQALIGSFRSAWWIEGRRLAHLGRPVWHVANPFWRYGLGFVSVLIAAGLAAGPWGAVLYLLMCAVAVLQLEAVNYVEHYGLTRRYLGNGRFERAALHHSWNASHRISNLLLINLQRHSDHHARPDRRYPLLQHHSWKEAPQLPFSYAVMIFVAMIPPLWFRMMEPRLTRWRRSFYPDIEDWRPYEDGSIGQESANA